MDARVFVQRKTVTRLSMNYWNTVCRGKLAPPHWWNCCLFNYACAWAASERTVAGLAAGFYLSIIGGISRAVWRIWVNRTTVVRENNICFNVYIKNLKNVEFLTKPSFLLDAIGIKSQKHPSMSSDCLSCPRTRVVPDSTTFLNLFPKTKPNAKQWYQQIAINVTKLLS